MFHFISTTQLTRQCILEILCRAQQIKKSKIKPPQLSKTIINLFYEPSTRTSCSFQAAAIKLGCSVINLNPKDSSIEKGESFEDNIKTLACFGDEIVLRHPSKEALQKAALISEIPIINAGNGNDEHPTQAMLDIFTIYTELSNFGLDLECTVRKTITITFLGDLKNSRTIHSLLHLLILFPKIKFIYIGLPTLEIPKDIMEEIHHEQHDNLKLKEAISITDVLYVTRIQKERLNKEMSFDQHDYCVDKNLMAKAKKNMIVMHPLPRLTEISTEVDDDPRAVYFKQIINGIYIRMAILEKVFNAK
jgi:aspartate carbamoyltransferase